MPRSTLTSRITSAEVGPRTKPGTRRAEILTCAVDVAKTDGLGAITLRRIATELGVAPSLSSHHFTSVELLVTAAFRSFNEAGLSKLIKTMAAADSPTAKISRFVRILETAEPSAAAVWVDVWRLGRSNKSLRAELDRQNTLWSDALADVLNEGLRQKVFRLTDPAASAFKLLVAVDGLFTQRLTRSADASTLTQMATTFVDAELGLRRPATVAPAAHPIPKARGVIP